MEFLNTIPWLSVHVTAVMLTLLMVVVADLHGLWWLLGKTETLPKKRMEWLHKLTWAGLGVIILAGGMMFSSYPEYLLSLTAFKLKMMFVLALVINAFLIGKHMKVAFEKRFKDISNTEKKAMIISGAVSTTSWLGAYIAAQFLG